LQLKNITSDKNIESLERSLNSVIGEQNRLEEREEELTNRLQRRADELVFLEVSLRQSDEDKQ
jgi:hypothetical protein